MKDHDWHPVTTHFNESTLRAVTFWRCNRCGTKFVGLFEDLSTVASCDVVIVKKIHEA